jgi:phosphoserine aminotransferase
MRKRNFCAGPSVISEQVLSEVKDELLEWGDSGMSIMEMSHRSKIYDGVAVDAKQDFIDIFTRSSFSSRWSNTSIFHGPIKLCS